MTYSQGGFLQTSITTQGNDYFIASFLSALISILALSYALSDFKSISLKQALLGENYQESSTSLVIQKSDLATTKFTAESIFVALFVKWLLNKENLENIDFIYSQSSFKANKLINTYWAQFFDYPVDSYNNPDIAQLINVNKF